MKSLTVIAVLSAALCMTGCKYDKAGRGGAGDLASGQDIAAQDIGNINDFTEGKFDELYTRCTDVNFAPVYFGFDSTVVQQSETPKIDAVVSHLTEKADRVVIVEGNCDERGSSEYNMALGENRAIIIRNYLVQSGIAADRIQTRSYGAEKPAVDGHDESAWRQNRRGEFAIFQK